MLHTTLTLLRNLRVTLTPEQLEARKLSQLPSLLHQAVVGMLLGDAGAYRTSSSQTSNTRLEWSFGKNRLAYAQYVAELMAMYHNTPIAALQVLAGGILHTSFRLKTVALPIFNYYRSIFYVYNPELGKWVKIVPANIQELITPISLAHLIMGDGNYDAGRNRMRIYTNGFSQSDNQRLANAITTNLGIKVGVMHDRANQYILTIGAMELDTLRKIVGPHMHPSMLYRIGVSTPHSLV